MRRYFLIIFLLVPAFVACTQRAGQLKPLRPAGVEELLLAAQPQLVTFSELQAEPEAFQDRLIRVSGTLLKLPPPECLPKSGPAVAWALIAEELRLDAIGFERVISLSSDDLPMTVDGFFRLYEGPLGCGKGAPDGSAWFLEVVRIVQPNPLVGAGQPSGSVGFPTTEAGGLSPTPGGPIAPTAPSTPSGTGTPGSVPTATLTPPMPPMLTATPEGGTPSATSIPTATATGQATSEPTPTPLPGTITSTPQAGTATPTPTATLGSGPTQTPTPTATSDPYVGPPTPTATPTVDGYPGATATGVPTTYP
jgi:hypothetical protein